MAADGCESASVSTLRIREVSGSILAPVTDYPHLGFS
jgi:hypothetical protein